MIREAKKRDNFRKSGVKLTARGLQWPTYKNSEKQRFLETNLLT